MRGDNRLPVLVTELAAAIERYRAGQRSMIDGYLAAGELLAEAKATVKHGQWLPWLGAQGVKPRQAQRMMQLAASGLTAEEIARAGGIRAALERGDAQRKALAHWAKANETKAHSEAKAKAALAAVASWEEAAKAELAALPEGADASHIEASMQEADARRAALAMSGALLGWLFEGEPLPDNAPDEWKALAAKVEALPEAE